MKLSQGHDASTLELVRQCDVRGVLHSHSRYGDGAHSLAAMIDTAREIGLEYLGVSDHFRVAGRQNGLDAEGIARQRKEIESLKVKFPGFDILQGAEVDVGPDGSFPVDDEILQSFDYVLVSLTNGASEDVDHETERALRVLDNPLTSILSKPVGDFMMRKPPVSLDMERVLQKAAKVGVAVEIDANPHSFELDWSHCIRAQELGVYLSINPNAHRAARLVDYRHGVELARNAGICCRSILNTLTTQELRAYIARQH